MNVKTLAFIIATVITFQYNSSAQIFSEQSLVVGVDHTFQPRALMGGGAAFFDFDQDGDEDLYLNGGLAGDDLYQNNGNGSFSKLGSTSTGLDITKQYNTTAIITGDIDNDGDRDIFLSTWEKFSDDQVARNLLLENKGDGTFEEIGMSAGITDAAFTIGANFVDYNKDGFIDIHVMNHIETPAFLYDNNGAIVGFDHDCFDNFFYLNNGDQTFTEVANQLGINDSGCALAALASDYDMDGDPDIFIANDFGPFIVPNKLYQNDYPNNGFLDVSTSAGAGIPMYGMGIASGDYDQDLDFDYYITNLGQNVLMENQNNTFVDVAVTAQVDNTNPPGNDDDFATGWGTAFFDIDNDTWLDLFVSNGRIPSLSSLPTAQDDPNRLFLNNGDKTFSDITDQNGVGDPLYGRGMAYSDFDQDGDLDFVVVIQNELGGTTKFYRNDANNDNHFVQFKLVGKESNRDAYGAKVWLHAGGQTFVREIDGGGGSFCSQNTSIVHFGLSTIDQIDSVRVDWPNGHVDYLGAFEIDAQHVVEEGIIIDGIKDLAAFDVTITPNPFEEYFTVNINGDWEDKALLELLTLDGKILLQDNLQIQNGQTQFRAAIDLLSGVYILRLKGTQGTIVKKVIKH